MDYLDDMYGQRSDEFYNGVIAGMTMYAWWKDGVQWVGSGIKTLKVAVAEVQAKKNRNTESV